VQLGRQSKRKCQNLQRWHIACQWNLPTFFSNSLTLSPSVILPESKTSFIILLSSSPILKSPTGTLITLFPSNNSVNHSLSLYIFLHPLVFNSKILFATMKYFAKHIAGCQNQAISLSFLNPLTDA